MQKYNYRHHQEEGHLRQLKIVTNINTEKRSSQQPPDITVHIPEIAKS